MKLLTKEILKKFPKLGETSNMDNPPIIAKFFTPDADWTWYATEFDGEDTFFGLVDGQYKELGTFSLSELQSVRGLLNLPVERDRHFKGNLKDVL